MVVQMEIEIFRNRAKEWRVEAASASESSERETCLRLAEGYEHLVKLLLRLRDNEGIGR